MGKMYEALEQARKEKKGFGTPSGVPVEGRFHSGKLELKADREMIQLYQNIVDLLPDKPHKVVLFIGSQKGEGTSTIVREFAYICAGQLGKSILLLDGDRQEPSHHSYFGLNPYCGWEDVLKGGEPLEKAVYQVEKTSLFICPVSPGSAQMPQDYYSLSMGDFWETLKRKFDLVLIDAPPAASSPDGIALARGVDGVVLVLEADKTRWPVIVSVKSNIEQGGGKILGIVFNKRRYYIPRFIYQRL